MERLRRQTKHGPTRLAADLQHLHGITLAPATVHRILVRRVLTDNGSCYRSRAWAAALATTRTKHKRTRPYTPRTNGKVERFNGTLAQEWAYVRDYSSEHERRAALADFLNYYNHDRPHTALCGNPPISRTAGSDYRITFDQPPEPLDALPRQLTIKDFVEPTS